MKLRDYHCVRLGIKISVPFDKGAWGRIADSFSESTVAANKGRARSIRSVLESSARTSDYHYHFFADKSKRKGKASIDLEISLHTNNSTGKKKKDRLILEIEELESWLLRLLGKRFENFPFTVDWYARFIFDKPPFEPVFPMPFKMSFDIPQRTNVLGEVSISGLKLEIKESAIGLDRVYFEALPDSLTVGTFFNQKTVLRSGLLEDFLKTAAAIPLLLVREEQKS